MMIYWQLICAADSTGKTCLQTGKPRDYNIYGYVMHTLFYLINTILLGKVKLLYLSTKESLAALVFTSVS